VTTLSPPPWRLKRPATETEKNETEKSEAEKKVRAMAANENATDAANMSLLALPSPRIERRRNAEPFILAVIIRNNSQIGCPCLRKNKIKLFGNSWQATCNKLYVLDLPGNS
jgi:hypothetical protein